MSTAPFQFSAPAQLYAKHPHIPDIVEEMRQESYRSIGEFRTLLLAGLRREVQPARLCQKTTNTSGAYVGAAIQYIWIGNDCENEWGKMGMAYFFCPLPDKIQDEKRWRTSLALIAESVLLLTVSCGGPDKEALGRIMSLVKRPEFHAEQTKKDEFSASLQLDSADPVGSATRQVAGLLRAISEAQHGNR